MSTQTITIDWDAIHCDWRHLPSTGKGWAKRLIELGGTAEEAAMLRERLRKGMAAEIELARIKSIANGNTSVTM
jgi:hypothetical protein